MSQSVQHNHVCVIGAGPCGLTSIRNLKKHGIADVVCHEAYDSIGGLWAYSDDPERPSVYDSAHIISSQKLSTFLDFPMPHDYPDYPSHRQILSYFKHYAHNFDLYRHIRFNSRVENAKRRQGGGWTLTISDGDGTHEETADYLMVAAGHHRIPFIPPEAEQFEGQQMHSGQYRSSKGLDGKRVLVIGGGNSACDIASAISRVSDHVDLSLRSPQYIVPKTVLGRPVDRQFRKVRRLPLFMRDALLKLGVRLIVGRYARYGLPEPKTKVLATHPTLNTEILESLTHGRVRVRGKIDGFSGSQVHFADGSAVHYDLIIWATGYLTKYPFLPQPEFDWSQESQLPLYLKMMPPDIEDVFFIGMIQPSGSIWPLADFQARYAAKIITGKIKRPADIAALIKAEQAAHAARFIDTPRHAMEVDFYNYIYEIKRKLEA